MSVQSVVGSPPSSLCLFRGLLKSNEEMGRNGSRFDVELRLAPEFTPARPASALRSLRAAAGPRPHIPPTASRFSSFQRVLLALGSPRLCFVNQTPILSLPQTPSRQGAPPKLVERSGALT